MSTAMQLGASVRSRAAALSAPWIVFGTAVVVHVVILLTANADLEGDEFRYLRYAQSLRDGYFVQPDGSIANGPIYPAILAALETVNVPVRGLKLANVLALAGAAGLVAATARTRVSKTLAVVAGLAFAFNAAALAFGSLLYTESVASLLLVAAAWLLATSGDDPRWPRLALVAVLFGLFTMVKFVFAIVLLVGIGVCGLVWLVHRGPMRRQFGKAAATAVAALVVCVPYLAYTQSETGKTFYWSTTGGEHLYWMTVGGEDLWGDWIPSSEVNDHQILRDRGYAAEITAAFELPAVERDDHLFSLAWDNVRDDPVTYGRNVAANVGRVLFNMPYSFRSQSLFTYAYIIPNLVLYGMVAWALARLPWHWGDHGFWNLWMVALALLGILGNFPVASAARQVLPFIGVLVPFAVTTLHGLKLVRPSRGVEP